MTLTWTHLTVPYATGTAIEAHALHCHHAALATAEPETAIGPADVDHRLAALAAERADLIERLGGTAQTLTVHQGRCLLGHGRACETDTETDAVRAAAITAAIGALSGDETRTGHIGDLGPYATYQGIAAAVVDAIREQFTLTARAGSPAH